MARVVVMTSKFKNKQNIVKQNSVSYLLIVVTQENHQVFCSSILNLPFSVVCTLVVVARVVVIISNLKKKHKHSRVVSSLCDLFLNSSSTVVQS